MPEHTNLEKNGKSADTETVLSESNFEQLKNRIQLPESAKETLYHINLNTNHTSCGKRIILSNLIIVAIVWAILIPTAIFASNLALHIYDAES